MVFVPYNDFTLPYQDAVVVDPLQLICEKHHHSVCFRSSITQSPRKEARHLLSPEQWLYTIAIHKVQQSIRLTEITTTIIQCIKQELLSS